MDSWKYWYQYRALVRLGAAHPITCPDCGVPLVPMIGDDNEVVLWCITDDSEVVPGTQFWADIKSVVDNSNVE